MGVTLPDGSIYFWMYRQGLAQADLGEILYQAAREGREVRPKDLENYWNGWYNHQLYRSERDIMSFGQHGVLASRDMRYSDYPDHPMAGQPEILNRWVPCSAEGKPLIKWSKGCMTKMDAMCMRGCKTLAENLKGTRMIVVDCDGDHDEEHLDLETIRFLSKFRYVTHCMSKPKKCWEYDSATDDELKGMMLTPASFHLTFTVDKVVPTMHFPAAHIDIIGNKMNSLRYMKNKVWNGRDPIPMTDEIWDEIMSYIRGRS